MSDSHDPIREQLIGARRNQILDAATEVFSRKGFHRATTKEIARAAGVSEGTIYNYFDSKRSLMLAIIDEVARAHLAFIQDHVRQEEDPCTRLERFFEAGFSFVANHLAQARVMINTLYGPDVGFKHELYAAYQPMFQLVSRDILVPGVAEGYFRHIDPDATALLLMTIYLGTGSQVSEDGRVWLDPGQVADFALHALCRSDQLGHEGT